MKKKICLIIFISTMHAANASDFSFCAKQSNDRERLICFDRIVEDLGITIKKKEEEKTSNNEQSVGDLTKWVVSNSSSEMDDSPTVTLELEAENTVRGYLSDAYRPDLIVRCAENKTDMFLVTQTQFESSGLYSAKAKIRLDKGKARHQNFSLATTRKSIFFKKPIGNIKNMFKASTMKIEWTPFNSNPVVATFDIRGLEETIKPLRKACNWGDNGKRSTNLKSKKQNAKKSISKKSISKERKTSLIAWGSRIRNHVDRRWHRPPGTKGNKAKVKITISNAGFISSGINLKSCNGSAEFCSSVREAFERSEPLPRPPNNYNFNKNERTVTFTLN